MKNYLNKFKGILKNKYKVGKSKIKLGESSLVNITPIGVVGYDIKFDDKGLYLIAEEKAKKINTWVFRTSCFVFSSIILSTCSKICVPLIPISMLLSIYVLLGIKKFKKMNIIKIYLLDDYTHLLIKYGYSEKLSVTGFIEIPRILYPNKLDSLKFDYLKENGEIVNYNISNNLKIYDRDVLSLILKGCLIHDRKKHQDGKRQPVVTLDNPTLIFSDLDEKNQNE